jgi:hypothetical protein
MWATGTTSKCMRAAGRASANATSRASGERASSGVVAEGAPAAIEQKTQQSGRGVRGAPEGGRLGMSGMFFF